VEPGFRLAPARSNHVMLVRERLLDRVRSRWFVPVTVIEAPAGYGKSTLLGQALAANADAPLGIDCFLACGTDAAAASALGAALLRAVDAPGPGRAGDADVAEVAAAVSEALLRRSPQQVCLVVDDVHEIPAGSEASELLRAVVAGLPDNAHAVLAGRTPPPVPLARLDAAGEVVHIVEDDLAFTADEVAEFAALRGAPAERLASCGGWPALTELASRSGQRATSPDDYVGEEVLAPLTPTERHRLTLLAHIGRFDDELARAVLSDADSDVDPAGELDIDELLSGIPLVSTDADGRRTLHSLWQSLLARAASPADIAGARRRAAAVVIGRGQTTEAVRLLIEAEAWPELLKVVVDALGIARPPVPQDVLASWHARLPPEVAETPAGRLLAAVVTSVTDPAVAQERLHACVAEFRAEGDVNGELAALVHIGEKAWWTEDHTQLGMVAMRAFELEAQGHADAVTIACLARALLHDIQNDSRQALRELDRVDPAAISGLWQGLVGSFRASGLLHLGDAEGARVVAEAALAQALPTSAPTIESARLRALWFMGHLDEVASAAPRIVDRVEATRYSTQVPFAAAEACFALALAGDVESARGYLDRATAPGAKRDVPMVDTAVAVAEAIVAVLTGGADGEQEAAGILAEYLDRHALGDGLSSGGQQRALTLFYVLLPETRPTWEASEMGPAFAVGRELARAVVAVRETGRLPDDAPELPATPIARAHLPEPWLTRLALAAAAAGRDDGERVLEETWPAARPSVLAVAEEADGPLRKAAKATLSRLAVPPTSHLDLRLLGAVELRRDGVPVADADWRRERVRSLLAYLVLHGSASRAQIGADLWPALDPHAQSANLRVTLTYLLRVLEPRRGARDPSFFVRQSGTHLELAGAGWLAVDLWDFDARCAAAEDADRRHAPSAMLTHALPAIEMWRGGPTDLATEAWAVGTLEQRFLRFAALATRAGELLLARGRIAHAQTLADQALAIDPLLEAAHRLVVACHRAAHDNVAAHLALARYRDAISNLGLPPDERTLMVERLLAHAGSGSS
jgi:DNA-binding SARP family transcriptional activator